MTTKFIRRNWNRHSKLGRRRKKKMVWRRPTGIDNKMREKRRGYAPSVGVGYKKSKANQKTLFLLRNVKDLEKMGEGSVGVLGNVGKKKKTEIVKKAKEMKIGLWKTNPNKFLKKVNIQKENPTK